MVIYLERYMSRMQDATEIRSNCNFLISQGSVVTYLQCSGNVFITLCTEIHSESESEKILQIGLPLPKL